jgi:hypothetical protein
MQTQRSNALTTGLSLLGMIAALGWCGFTLADHGLAQHGSGAGTVARLIDHPAHSSVSCSNNHCHTNYYAETWELCADVNQGQACGDISQSAWSHFSVGEPVQVTYDIGALSGSYFLTSVKAA